jgi:hypothetical protein
LGGKVYTYDGSRNAEDMAKHMRAFAKTSWVDPREVAIETGEKDDDDGLFHC